MTEPYAPIDCAIHDVLEAAAVRRVPTVLRWREADGVETTRTARITDVYASGGAEWLELDDGTRLRLDRLVEVDGTAVVEAQMRPRPNPDRPVTGR